MDVLHGGTDCGFASPNSDCFSTDSLPKADVVDADLLSKDFSAIVFADTYNLQILPDGIPLQNTENAQIQNQTAVELAAFNGFDFANSQGWNFADGENSTPVAAYTNADCKINGEELSNPATGYTETENAKTSCTRNNCSENFPTNKLAGDVSAHEGEEKNLATGYTENSAPLADCADTDCAVSENQCNFTGSSKSENFQPVGNTSSANERAEQNCVPYAEKAKNSTIDNGENFAPVLACTNEDCKINGEKLSNALSNDCAEKNPKQQQPNLLAMRIMPMSAQSKAPLPIMPRAILPQTQ